MKSVFRTSPRRTAAVILTGALPLALIGLVAHRVAGDAPGEPSAVPDQGLGTVGHFFLAAAAVLLAGYLGGLTAGRLGQPRVIGEICAGLALGPTLLGRLSPGAAHWLFPEQTLPMLDGLAQLGLVLFMFGVGRELSGMRLRGTAAQALLVCQASFLVPFATGAAAAVPLAGYFTGGAHDPLVFALFLGCALSVTAFPVLARILADLRLTRTRPGQLSLLAAAVGDGAGWLVLAAILAGLHGAGPSGVIRNVLIAAVVTALFLGPLRKLLARWPDVPLTAGTPWREPEGGGATAMVLLAAGVAAMSALTAAVGVHQLIGALLVGLAWPTGHRQATAVADRLAGTAKTILLPFFFFGFGLTIDLGALSFDGPTAAALATLLVLAVTSKIAGPALSARLTGMPWRPALALGVLLNSRGLTELVILQVGYQADIIDQRLLSILTLIALATTAMTRPLLRLLGPDAVEAPCSAAGSAPPTSRKAPEPTAAPR